MVGADYAEVPGALVACATRQGFQPGPVILLSNALWHRWEIFRIDPTTAIV